MKPWVYFSVKQTLTVPVFPQQQLDLNHFLLFLLQTYKSVSSKHFGFDWTSKQIVNFTVFLC